MDLVENVRCREEKLDAFFDNSICSDERHALGHNTCTSNTACCDEVLQSSTQQCDTTAESDDEGERWWQLTLFCVIFTVLVACLVYWYASIHSPDFPWRQESSSFDLSIAEAALLLSKASYCDHESILNWTCETCLNYPLLDDFRLFRVYQNDTKSTLSLSGIFPRHRVVVVVFRGTSNIENWVNNMKFLFSPFPNTHCSDCSVHQGFLDAFLSLYEEIRGDVSYLLEQYPHYRVLVTGHSLGAALAQLHALDLLDPLSSSLVHELRNSFEGGAASDSSLPHLDQKPISRSSHGISFNPVHQERLLLYTFGSPRVGNENFVSWAAERLSFAFRLTHRQDIVPHVPPASMGYRHIPNEIWFSNDTVPLEYTICEDSSLEEDENCSSGVWMTDFSDHRLYLGISTRCPEVARQVEQY